MPLTKFERGDDWVRLFKGDMLTFARNLKKFVITPTQLSAAFTTPVPLLPGVTDYIYVPTSVIFNKAAGASYTTAGVTGGGVAWNNGVMAVGMTGATCTSILGNVGARTNVSLNNVGTAGAVYTGLDIPAGGELSQGLDFRFTGANPVSVPNANALLGTPLVVLVEYIFISNTLSTI